MEVNKNTTLADILKIDGAEKMLSKYQLPCLHCPMAKMEMEKLKIGEVCKMYGIDAKSLLEDLNRIL
ncbi:hypothetical protein KKC91_05650 [bacterium]|nr:hypothetical protein [bacterium]